MPPNIRPEMMLALIIVGRALRQQFEALTGMSLDEWDEQNHARIMRGETCPVS